MSTPFDFIVPEHFQPLSDRQAAIDLFVRSVWMVEIETFSYCNRRCWFCPNAIVDRHSSTEYMDDAIYLRILEQLAEAGYRQMISFSRYNEPLADRIILTRLAQARRALPHALLHTNTNGDYLTRDYLAELVDAGLRSLNIQIYLANEERYDHERMRVKLQKMIDALALDATLVRDERDIWLEATAKHGDLNLRLYARNFAVNGCDRGATVPIQIASRRTSPCLSPFYHVYIDYNGSVMPCCNLRSDVPTHANAVVANLSRDTDLFMVYGGETLAAWRRSLVGFEPKSGHCASCSFVPFAESPEHRAIHARLVTEAERAEATLSLAS